MDEIPEGEKFHENVWYLDLGNSYMDVYTKKREGGRKEEEWEGRIEGKRKKWKEIDPFLPFLLCYHIFGHSYL